MREEDRMRGMRGVDVVRATSGVDMVRGGVDMLRARDERGGLERG